MTDVILDHKKEVLTTLQRQHIVTGLAAVAMSKGYAATTIADIVSTAHVSKGTFYEHFDDKEAVYLELESTVTEAVETNLRASIERTTHLNDWRLRVRDLVRERLATVTSNGPFLAQLAIGPQVVSEAAQRSRMDANDRLVAIHMLLADQISKTTDEVLPIGAHVAYAGMSASTAHIAARAGDGTAAVLMLEEPLTDIWIRLLRA